MGLFRGMGGYLREPFEKTQPFGTRGDLLLDFPKGWVMCILAQGMNERESSGVHFKKFVNGVGPKFGEETI